MTESIPAGAPAPPKSDTELMRDAFHAYIRSLVEEADLTRQDDGYAFAPVQSRWLTWQRGWSDAHKARTAP